MTETVPHHTLYGFTMSPFSMKMRSYLRYRRIPFIWVAGAPAHTVAETKVETYMVPVLESPEGDFMTDSTLMMDRLEVRFPQRSAIPEHEADAFLASLIEDLMDEWVMWPFYVYRWRTEADALHNSRWILYEHFHGKTKSSIFEQMSKFWATRQIKGMDRFCGDPEILDESLETFLSIADDVFSNGLFMFGSRPSRAEFAIYGILSQMIIDPTAASYMREKFNNAYRWTTVMEDLSGIEAEWKSIASDPDSLEASRIPDILKLSGTYHLPLLDANEKALANGEKDFSVEMNGKLYSRKAHNRHDGCLLALRHQYANLSDHAKSLLDRLLKDTGCFTYLAGAA